MFRIGEFSRITRVTIDTLRHYDALGILKPANVDPFTGYRYYSANQLMSLNRILALKEVGFSLDEIAPILQEKLTNDQLREMLRAQLERAEHDIQAAQSRRGRILARLVERLPENRGAGPSAAAPLFSGFSWSFRDLLIMKTSLTTRTLTQNVLSSSSTLLLSGRRSRMRLLK